MTKEEWTYLYNGTISQAGDEPKLDTLMKTGDTGSTANSTICNEVKPLILASEKGIVDNEKRFFCINCSKFIEHEYVRSDSNDRPSVHHKNGHKHTVMFGSNIQRLLEFGTSQLGQITRYETAEMYGISVEELDQILANVGGDL